MLEKFEKRCPKAENFQSGSRHPVTSFSPVYSAVFIWQLQWLQTTMSFIKRHVCNITCLSFHFLNFPSSNCCQCHHNKWTFKPGVCRGFVVVGLNDDVVNDLTSRLMLEKTGFTEQRGPKWGRVILIKMINPTAGDVNVSTAQIPINITTSHKY